MCPVAPVLALWRLRQEGHMFKSSLSYIALSPNNPPKQIENPMPTSHCHFLRDISHDTKEKETRQKGKMENPRSVLRRRPCLWFWGRPEGHKKKGHVCQCLPSACLREFPTHSHSTEWRALLWVLLHVSSEKSSSDRAKKSLWLPLTHGPVEETPPF